MVFWAWRNSRALTQDDVTKAMQKLNATFMTLAGRFYSVHEAVQKQKELCNVLHRLEQHRYDMFSIQPQLNAFTDSKAGLWSTSLTWTTEIERRIKLPKWTTPIFILRKLLAHRPSAQPPRNSSIFWLPPERRMNKDRNKWVEIRRLSAFNNLEVCCPNL